MTTETNEKRDSVSVSTRDTATKVTDIVQQNNITAKDLDVVIEYLDTMNDYQTPPVVDESGYSRVISVYPRRPITPKKITIHIASLKDSTRTVTHIDSAGVKTKDTTSIHTQVNDVVKTVDRKGMAFGSYILFGIIALVIIVLLYLKFIKL